MSNAATAQQPAPVTDLALVEQAIDGIDKVSQGLAALKQQHAGVVYDVSTLPGMTAAKAARQSIRAPRYEVERIRKAAKAPLLALGRRLDGEAQRIIREIEAIEAPIDQQIVAEEQRVAREREEAIERERLRTETIQKKLQAIRGLPLLAVGKTAVQLAALLRDMDEVFVKGFDFQEFAREAQQGMAEARAVLQAALDERVRLDEEAKRQRLEREQLDRQKAEQDQRDRLAREETERRQKELDEREAGLQRQAANTLDGPQSQMPYTPTQVEADAGAPELLDVPEFLKAQPPAPGRRVRMRPSEHQIIEALALHFGVPEATGLAWLLECDFVGIKVKA